MITYNELNKMKAKEFLYSLIRYNNHFLAYEVSAIFGVEDKSFIVEDWAIKKLHVVFILNHIG